VTSQQVTSQQVDSQQVDSQQVDSQQTGSQQVADVEADSVPSSPKPASPSSPIPATPKTVEPLKLIRSKKTKGRTSGDFFSTDPEDNKLTLALAAAAEERGDEVPDGDVGKTPVAAPLPTVEPQPEPKEEVKKGSKKGKQPTTKLDFLRAAVSGTAASAKLPSAKVGKNLSNLTDLSDL
jgi:hypothetical protein